MRGHVSRALTSVQLQHPWACIAEPQQCPGPRKNHRTIAKHRLSYFRKHPWEWAKGDNWGRVGASTSYGYNLAAFWKCPQSELQTVYGRRVMWERRECPGNMFPTEVGSSGWGMQTSTGMGKLKEAPHHRQQPNPHSTQELWMEGKRHSRNF